MAAVEVVADLAVATVATDLAAAVEDSVATVAVDVALAPLRTAAAAADTTATEMLPLNPKPWASSISA